MNQLNNIDPNNDNQKDQLLKQQADLIKKLQQQLQQSTKLNQS